MRYAIRIGAAADGLECHMHVRARPPPGKDDAVQQARARGIPALDERDESAFTGLDLINWFEELKQRVTTSGK